MIDTRMEALSGRVGVEGQSKQVKGLKDMKNIVVIVGLGEKVVEESIRGINENGKVQ